MISGWAARLESRISYQKLTQVVLVSLLVSLLVLGYVAIRSLREMTRARHQITERYAQAVVIAADLQYRQAQEDAESLLLLYTGSPSLRDEIVRTRAQFDSLLRKLEQVDPAPDPQEDVAHIAALKRKIVAASELGYRRRIDGGSAERAFRDTTITVKPTVDAIHAALAEMFQNELNRFLAARDRSDATSSAFVRTLALITTSIVVLGFAVLLLLMRLGWKRGLADLERERRYRQAQRAAQGRKEALEAVSHDLKNPLTAIDLNLRLLRRGTEAGTPAAKPIEVGLAAVSSMRELIQSLLDHAKLEAGTAELALRYGDVRPVIREVAEVNASIARAKGAALDLQLSEDLPTARFDVARLRQVVSNIVGNAVKFTPEGGKITVSADRRDDSLHVCVSDDGPGIPPENLGHVFERFWQADSPAREQGTGLGLAIAKGIVDAHGGRIWAENRAGGGACFHFTLPAATRVPGAVPGLRRGPRDGELSANDSANEVG